MASFTNWTILCIDSEFENDKTLYCSQFSAAIEYKDNGVNCRKKDINRKELSFYQNQYD